MRPHSGSVGLSPVAGWFARAVHDKCHGRMVGRVKRGTAPDVGVPTADARATLRLARGVTATWWYTLSVIVFFEVMIVVVWLATLLEAGVAAVGLWAIAIGGSIWLASTLPLLSDYRHRTDAGVSARSPRVLVPLLIAAAYGAVSVVITGSLLHRPASPGAVPHAAELAPAACADARSSS